MIIFCYVFIYANVTLVCLVDMRDQVVYTM